MGNSSSVQTIDIGGLTTDAKLENVLQGRISDNDRYLPDIATWTNYAYAILRSHQGDKKFDELLRTQFDKNRGCCSGISWLNHKCRIFGLKFGLATMVIKKVLTHPVGVGARGRATVLKNDLIPETEFFTPGKTFDVRVRHGKFSMGEDKNDDRLVAGFSLSIKFADTDFESPWDIMANTGRLSSFFNLRTAEWGVNARSVEGKRKLFNKSPVTFSAFIDSHRLNPQAISKLYYMYWPTHEFYANDGVPRWVRFRVIPADHLPEQPTVCGYLDVYEQMRLFSGVPVPIAPDEDRSPSYLRDEFLNMVETTGVNYTVQIQIRTEVDEEAFNVSREWDENQFPWLDLINVELNAPLTETELKKMAFYPGHLPPCVKIPMPVDGWDYKSVQYIRTKVYPRVQNIRRK